MGSKDARFISSIINQPSGGGDKKIGLRSQIGHNSNVYFRLERETGTPGAFNFVTYGSTTKGLVGGIRTYH